jgi:NAD-dependent DNA ligase/DNA polymerase/3'-5' exonuclease PolX
MLASVINNKDKTEKNKKVKGGPCIFPFKYKWKNHNECYKTDKGEICATEVNSKGTLVKYGYCTIKSRQKKRKTIKVPKRFRHTKVRTMNKIEKTKQSTSQAKMKIQVKVKNSPSVKVKLVLNDKFIDLLDQLHDMDQARGKVFEAIAYKRAAESIMSFPDDITSPEQVKDLPGIGKKIYVKFHQYLETGTVPVLEKEKNHPRYVFYKIYGVGPKKAIELVDKDGITTIKQLRENTQLLNDKQKIGLKYYDDILKRIPREEIIEFKSVLDKSFKKVAKEGDTFEIVGSYRRGSASSGDIDIIISSNSEGRKVYKDFVSQLQKDGILLELLSKGSTKSLTIGKLPTNDTVRRLDFMFAPWNELAFSTLYFTGSKAFNVVQRKRANDMGMTMNEHGLYKLIGQGKNKKKGEKIEGDFPTEKSIFDFLGMVYKNPTERKNGRAVVLKKPSPPEAKYEGESKSETKSTINKKIAKIKVSKKVKVKRNTTIKVAPSLKPVPKKTDLINKWGLLTKEGISAVKGFTEEEMCVMIRFASDNYYNSGKPIASDNIFDILKEYGQRTYPKNPCFNEIGAQTNKKKVKLPYFMGSMEKIKPDTGALPKYLKKYPGLKEVSAKLDGISALYTTEGDQPRMYTRGAATNGLDISYIIPYMKLPEDKDIVIRGELIIDQKIFADKYSAEYKNPRNMVSGVIASSKKREVEKWEDIDFVAYEVIKPSLRPSMQMKWLEEHDAITVLHETSDEISNELLSTLLVKWRENYKYEIDGIIVVDDKIYPRRDQNPDFAFAFKMVLSDQIAEVKVIDVIWTASKDGYLKPVVRVDPVRIRGADIEFVTAFNAKFVEDNKIGIGAIIQLIRSGDVIPHIQAVIQPAETAKMPAVSWHWNDTHVDAITDVVDDPDVLQKNIEFFFKKLDIAGVGPGNVKRLIAGGYNTIPKIIAMTKDDLLTVRGIKDKTANKIHTNIHRVIDSASLVMIASGSNIFGRGLGPSILRNIIHEYPNIFESPEDNKTKVIQVAKVDNVSYKRASMFVSNIPDFIEFMTEAKLTHKFKEQGSTTIDKGHPLYGKRVVMTGPKDKSLKKKLIELGTKIGTSVNSKTFAVLIEHSSVGEEGKKEKAKELGIPIITFEEFRKKYL